MQPLTDPVYRNLTAAQVVALIAAPSLVLSAGLELFDHTDTFVADISSDLVGGTISHKNSATIHGTASLSLSRALTWGSDRVRPYMTLTDPATGRSGRWNLGVYVMATPKAPFGESPATYSVSGSDKLYLLGGPVGDSYSVAAGANVLTAVTTAITAGSGVSGSQVILDGTASASTLPAARVWPLGGSGGSATAGFTWLDIVNDLLGMVGYQNLWCDWDGKYRSGPAQDPAVRSSEYTFSADDGLATLVGPARTVTADLWQAPNWWRFIGQSWASTPAEGNGFYTVQNLSSGPASQQAVGRVVKKVVYLQAADQASLVNLGNIQVAQDKAVVTSVAVNLAPMPAQWHLDVATYVDSAVGATMKVATSDWTLDLGGADGQTNWDVVQS
jgi:hypothetical protein